MTATPFDTDQAAEKDTTTAAQIMKALLKVVDREQVYDALNDEFEWLDSLDSEDRQEFLSDVMQTMYAAVDTGDMAILGQTIREWRNAGLILQDPELTRILTEPVVEVDLASASVVDEPEA